MFAVIVDGKIVKVADTAIGARDKARGVIALSPEKEVYVARLIKKITTTKPTPPPPTVVEEDM